MPSFTVHPKGRLCWLGVQGAWLLNAFFWLFAPIFVPRGDTAGIPVGFAILLVPTGIIGALAGLRVHAILSSLFPPESDKQ